MRKILLASFKNVWKLLAAISLILILNFAAIGHLNLLPAVLIGYILAAAYIASSALRLSSIMQLSHQQANRHMLFGLLLRFTMLFIVLLAGLQISQAVFFSIVAGFFAFYLIALFGLIFTSYNDERR